MLGNGDEGGPISKTWPPKEPTRSTPHRLHPRLAQGGWSQIYSKVPTAPHDVRFIRVPGGWRPRVRKAPALEITLAAARSRIQDVMTLSPHELPEGEPSPRWEVLQGMHRDVSQASMMTASSRVTTVGPSALSLTRPDGQPREKRPYRRDPHLSPAIRQWPSRFLKENQHHLERAQVSDDPLDNALEELKTLILKRSTSRGSSKASSSRSRRSSPAPAVSTRASILGRRGSQMGLTSRRGSIGDLSEKLRRASATSLGVSSTHSMSDSSGEDPFVAARAAAEEAQAEAEEAGLPSELCRQRRQACYAEALLKISDVHDLQNDRLRPGGGLEDFEEVDTEVEKLIKEDIAELAQLFAEFDGGLEGIMQQHDLRSVLRLLGRAMTEDEVRNLLNCLESVDDENGSGRDIDFREFVELCDMRLHTEKLYLRGFYRERFRGASSNSIQPHLRDVADAMEGVKVHVRPEQLERTALELGYPVWAGYVTLENETQLFVLAQKCRELERQRAWERAGFSLEQVSRFQQLFDSISTKHSGRGIRFEGILYIIHQLGIIPKSRADEADLEATAFNGRDRSEILSFLDCLHSARRFLDKKEMDARSKELRAADIAGIPQEELEIFRAFYKQLIAEDTQGNKKDFSYFALCRGVQIMGATLTVERNAELEQMFKEHAMSSSVSSKLHLPFPKFIVMMGTLFKLDFAGLRTTAARSHNHEEGEDRIRKLTVADGPHAGEELIRFDRLRGSGGGLGRSQASWGSEDNPMLEQVQDSHFLCLDGAIALATGARLAVYRFQLHVQDMSDDIKRLQRLGSYRCCGLLTLPREPTAGHGIVALAANNAVLSGTVLVASSSKRLYVWDVAAEKVLAAVPDPIHMKAVTCLRMAQPHAGQSAASMDMFYSAGLDGCIKLWDLRTMQECRCFRSGHVHTAQRLHCRLSPCLRYMATPSEDGCVCVYDVRTGNVLGTKFCHKDTAVAVDLHPRTGAMASGGFDGMVQFFRSPLSSAPGRPAGGGMRSDRLREAAPGLREVEMELPF
ncbi:WDR27 [Symbiodinium pilosum]|uniref:WDR27 protein n=1 Tax=Symbiodinium pilosum TaxID=2952 RepID=A0A812W7V6_SYMPI|nr:WDR27 [Symbiodinium pilosum]